MNLEEWSLSDVPGLAVHSSGLMVRISGSATNPTEVKTINVPEGLSFHDQARLLRAGMEYLAQNTKNIPLSRRIKSSPQMAKREKVVDESENTSTQYARQNHSSRYEPQSYSRQYEPQSFSRQYETQSFSREPAQQPQIITKQYSERFDKSNSQRMVLSLRKNSQ